MSQGNRKVQYLVTIAVCLASVTVGVLNWTPWLIYDKIGNYNPHVQYIFIIMMLGFLMGSLVTRYISDRFGRRATILASALPLTVGTIFTVTSYSVWPSVVWLLFFPIFLLGVGYGMVITISPIYLAEISDKEIRGLLTLSSLFMFHVGSILMGVIKDVMTDALKYMPVLPVLFFIVCWFIPETPYFTLKEGKVETAKTILMKLRKYKDDRELVEDLKSIRKDVKTETLRSGSLKELITRRQYRKAVIICIGLKLIQELSGGNLFHSCRYIVMPQSKINMKATTANSIFGGLQIVSVIVSSLLVDRVGRRPLLIGSYLGAGCALAITAAYSYDFEAFKIDKDDIFPYGQVLIVGITLAAIFSKIGYNSLIYVIPAEMFPMNVKSVAMTALNVFGELSSLAIQQLFWKLMSLNSFFGAITMFATISLVGCVFSIYLVPETKGKSLREILITLQGTAYKAAENLNEVTTIEMSKNEDNELLELKSAGHK